MPAFKIKSIRTFSYQVDGEPPMDSRLGPDATMIPYAAEMQIVNGALWEILVWGKIVGKNGKPISRDTRVCFRRGDLGIGPARVLDTDEVPLVVPAWVDELAVPYRDTDAQASR
jgi:hypothetical protein